MLQNLSPTRLPKHGKWNKSDSHIISLCLNQWVDKPWPYACGESPNSVKVNTIPQPGWDGEQFVDHTRAAASQSTDITNGKNFKERRATCCGKVDQTGNSSVVSETLGCQPTQSTECWITDKLVSPHSRNCLEMSKTDHLCTTPAVENSSVRNKFPLPLGCPFWPDEKNLQAQQTPKAYLSLPQDYKSPPQSQIRPLSDDEKTWDKKVGGTLFTGEGNLVSHGSYMHGFDWSRLPTSACPSNKREVARPQSVPNFHCISGTELQSPSLSARGEHFLPTSRMPGSNYKHVGRPLSASTTQNSKALGRPMSASAMQNSKVGLFSSPRSVLISPLSSRSSCSPRSGILSFESTPRTREIFGGALSAREIHASKNQADKMFQKIQSLRKRDAAAVRALF